MSDRIADYALLRVDAERWRRERDEAVHKLAKVLDQRDALLDAIERWNESDHFGVNNEAETELEDALVDLADSIRKGEIPEGEGVMGVTLRGKSD